MLISIIRKQQLTTGYSFGLKTLFEASVKNSIQKLDFLARIASYIFLTVMKAFVTSQFEYFPLVWMFHSRGINPLAPGVHEKVIHKETCSFQL